MALLASYDYDWSIVWDNLDELWRGLLVTLQLAVEGHGGGARARPRRRLLPHVPIAGALRARPRIHLVHARRAAVRVLFWIYYGLARTADIVFGAFAAGLVALGLTGSATWPRSIAAVYRASIRANEAGLAIGLGPDDDVQRVVFPQAIRIILAPTVNLFVGLLKGATIIRVIGVADMFYFVQIESLRRFQPFELYTAAGLILVAITIAVAGFAALLDRHLGRGASRG